MTYDFFASHDDQISIAKYVIDDLNLRVFDMYSSYDQSITEYTNSESLMEKVHTESILAIFNIWHSDFGPFPEVRKIQLDPKRCNGHTFRYNTEGLGLIQLYFGKESNSVLQKSHLGHFSANKARENEHNFIHAADEWNWNYVNKYGRKIRTYIKKTAVSKWSGYDLMPGASDVGVFGN